LRDNPYRHTKGPFTQRGAAIVDGDEYTTSILVAKLKQYLRYTHGMLVNIIQGIALDQ
jgi:hypothetical protein